MCGATPKVDTTVSDQLLADSKRAREEEEARKARITAGSADIDRRFGAFDQGFFDNYRNKQLDFAQPELDRQFGDARDQLTYALARSGTLNSSIAGDKLADLTGAYGTQRAALFAQADDDTAALRSNINNEKSSLLSLLNATGDANRATNEALSRSQQLLQTQPKFNPLGDLFAGVTGAIGNYYGAQQQRSIYNDYINSGPAANRVGSSRIVGGA